MAAPVLALLLSLLLAASSSLATSDGPFIVAHKKVALSRLSTGMERVTVTIDVYNEGSATAYDVSLSDDSWAHEVFDITSGSTSKTWERLDAGASVSHTFVLQSQVKGLYHSSPAVIKYRIPTKAALQEALSTPLQPLDILADKPPEKKFEWAKKLLARYGSQVSVLSLVGLFIYLVASPSKSNAAKGSKKRR
ncbi:translocon-associated protein subunit beta-like [Iris pallida]|uniref:Translocon-associated protein subunit beta-like n=1 Tax=Iris pallida TaxID=29817 RepID=A0AAX6I0Q7_IRIPA|nr:translocon-associated protein subunit beta-like [Iris pallida]